MRKLVALLGVCALAVTARIGRDNVVMLLEHRHLFVPHTAVECVTVNEDDGRMGGIAVRLIKHPPAPAKGYPSFGVRTLRRGLTNAFAVDHLRRTDNGYAVVGRRGRHPDIGHRLWQFGIRFDRICSIYDLCQHGQAKCPTHQQENEVARHNDWFLRDGASHLLQCNYFLRAHIQLDWWL